MSASPESKDELMPLRRSTRKSVASKVEEQVLTPKKARKSTSTPIKNVPDKTSEVATPRRARGTPRKSMGEPLTVTPRKSVSRAVTEDTPKKKEAGTPRKRLVETSPDITSKESNKRTPRKSKVVETSPTAVQKDTRRTLRKSTVTEKSPESKEQIKSTSRKSLRSTNEIKKVESPNEEEEKKATDREVQQATKGRRKSLAVSSTKKMNLSSDEDSKDTEHANEDLVKQSPKRKTRKSVHFKKEVDEHQLEPESEFSSSPSPAKSKTVSSELNIPNSEKILKSSLALVPKVILTDIRSVFKEGNLAESSKIGDLPSDFENVISNRSSIDDDALLSPSKFLQSDDEQDITDDNSKLSPIKQNEVNSTDFVNMEENFKSPRRKLSYEIQAIEESKASIDLSSLQEPHSKSNSSSNDIMPITEKNVENSSVSKSPEFCQVTTTSLNDSKSHNEKVESHLNLSQSNYLESEVTSTETNGVVKDNNEVEDPKIVEDNKNNRSFSVSSTDDATLPTLLKTNADMDTSVVVKVDQDSSPQKYTSVQATNDSLIVEERRDEIQTNNAAMDSPQKCMNSENGGKNNEDSCILESSLTVIPSTDKELEENKCEIQKTPNESEIVSSKLENENPNKHKLLSDGQDSLKTVTTKHGEDIAENNELNITDETGPKNLDYSSAVNGKGNEEIKPLPGDKESLTPEFKEVNRNSDDILPPVVLDSSKTENQEQRNQNVSVSDKPDSSILICEDAKCNAKPESAAHSSPSVISRSNKEIDGKDTKYSDDVHVSHNKIEFSSPKIPSEHGSQDSSKMKCKTSSPSSSVQRSIDSSQSDSEIIESATTTEQSDFISSVPKAEVFDVTQEINAQSDLKEAEALKSRSSLETNKDDTQDTLFEEPLSNGCINSEGDKEVKAMPEVTESLTPERKKVNVSNGEISSPVLDSSKTENEESQEQRNQNVSVSDNPDSSILISEEDNNSKPKSSVHSSPSVISRSNKEIDGKDTKYSDDVHVSHNKIEFSSPKIPSEHGSQDSSKMKCKTSSPSSSVQRSIDSSQSDSEIIESATTTEQFDFISSVPKDEVLNVTQEISAQSDLKEAEALKSTSSLESNNDDAQDTLFEEPLSNGCINGEGDKEVKAMPEVKESLTPERKEVNVSNGETLPPVLDYSKTENEEIQEQRNQNVSVSDDLDSSILICEDINAKRESTAHSSPSVISRSDKKTDGKDTKYSDEVHVGHNKIEFSSPKIPSEHGTQDSSKMKCKTFSPSSFVQRSIDSPQSDSEVFESATTTEQSDFISSVPKDEVLNVTQEISALSDLKVDEALKSRSSLESSEEDAEDSLLEKSLSNGCINGEGNKRIKKLPEFKESLTPECKEVNVCNGKILSPVLDSSETENEENQKQRNQNVSVSDNPDSSILICKEDINAKRESTAHSSPSVISKSDKETDGKDTKHSDEVHNKIEFSSPKISSQHGSQDSSKMKCVASAVQCSIDSSESDSEVIESATSTENSDLMPSVSQDEVLEAKQEIDAISNCKHDEVLKSRSNLESNEEDTKVSFSEMPLLNECIEETTLLEKGLKQDVLVKSHSSIPGKEGIGSSEQSSSEEESQEENIKKRMHLGKRPSESSINVVTKKLKTSKNKSIAKKNKKQERVDRTLVESFFDLEAQEGEESQESPSSDSDGPFSDSSETNSQVASAFDFIESMSKVSKTYHLGTIESLFNQDSLNEDEDDCDWVPPKKKVNLKSKDKSHRFLIDAITGKKDLRHKLEKNRKKNKSPSEKCSSDMLDTRVGMFSILTASEIPTPECSDNVPAGFSVEHCDIYSSPKQYKPKGFVVSNFKMAEHSEIQKKSKSSKKVDSENSAKVSQSSEITSRETINPSSTTNSSFENSTSKYVGVAVLPLRIKKREIKKVFSDAGINIVSVEYRSTTTALLEFAEKKSLKKALDLYEIRYQGMSIYVLDVNTSLSS